MNQFYNGVIQFLRGARSSVTAAGQQIYGMSSKVYQPFSIVSGTYDRWKHDQHPTFFVQWSDQKTTHGLNLHYINISDLQWFMRTIILMVRGGQQITPMMMYRFLKINRKTIIDTAYRTYHTSLLKCNPVSPGLSHLPQSSCVSIQDSRDGATVGMLNRQLFNPIVKPDGTQQQIAYNRDELNAHIIEVLNQRPINFQNNHDNLR
ncbi:hypothetical protein FACS1894109_21380 [Spirochaetia bacterium]|nr:hypothetical protein FACS1894109_21380 [Spirochaetia bacterium]